MVQLQLWMFQGSQEVNWPCSIFPHSYHLEVPSRWDMGHLASLVGWADCKLRTPTCQVSHWCLCEAPAKQAMPAGLEGCQGCSSLADFVANGRPSERKALQASLSSAQKCGRQFQTLALVLGIVFFLSLKAQTRKKNTTRQNSWNVLLLVYSNRAKLRPWPEAALTTLTIHGS